MEYIAIAILLVIMGCFGYVCYGLGKTNGYIEGYEEASDYAIEQMEKNIKRRERLDRFFLAQQMGIRENDNECD